jgi:hypothetical protein
LLDDVGFLKVPAVLRNESFKKGGTNNLLATSLSLQLGMLVKQSLGVRQWKMPVDYWSQTRVSSMSYGAPLVLPSLATW